MMEQLPESARRRLSSTAVETHPDPGLLTAFAEQSLTGEERDAVLQHLGACAVCREVVALAAPDTVVTEVPAVAAPSWFRSPMLHWAAVAATAVIVWAAVSVLVPRTTNRDVAARAELEATTAAVQQRPESAASASLPVADAMKTNQAVPRKKASARPAEHMAAQNAPAAAPARALDTLSATAETQTNVMHAERKQSTVTAEQPGTTGLGGALGKDAAVAFSKAVTAAQISGTVSDPSGAVVPDALVKITNAGDKTSIAVRTDAAGAYRTPVVPGVYSVEATSPGMQPARTEEIRIEGTVAKNFTLRPGFAAQTVAVTAQAAPPTAPPPPAPAANTLAVTTRKAAGDDRFAGLAAAKVNRLADVSRWRIGQDGSLEHFGNEREWQKVEVVPGMTFRAVGSGGGAVWVGGTDGTLFHGSDEGRAWHRVAIGPKNAPVSDAITAIAVPNASSVEVTTSTGEQWLSSDAGHTWKRLHPRQ